MCYIVVCCLFPCLFLLVLAFVVGRKSKPGGDFSFFLVFFLLMLPRFPLLWLARKNKTTRKQKKNGKHIEFLWKKKKVYKTFFRKASAFCSFCVYFFFFLQLFLFCCPIVVYLFLPLDFFFSPFLPCLYSFYWWFWWKKIQWEAEKYKNI